MVQSRVLMGAAANWHKKAFRKRFNKENGRKYAMRQRKADAIYWWLGSSE